MTKILNVAPGTTVLSAWGNSVTDELNNRTLKIDGLKSQDGTVMQMTGDLLLRNADPTNANHAARKSYVDAKDTLNLKLTGGTLTGTLVINENDSPLCLILRSQATGTGGSFTNSPYLAFYNAPQSTRFGYLQGSPSGLNLIADSGGINLTAGASGDINLNAGGGQVRSADALYVTGQGRFFLASGSPLVVGGSDAYISLYRSASNVDTLNTRSGYMGFPGSTTLTITNEVANGGTRITANGSGTLALATGTSGDISLTTGAAGNILLNSNTGVTVFTQGGAERGRASASFMWGKSTGGLANPGVELFEAGTIYSTTANNSTPNMSLRHNTNADAAFIQFWNASGGILSEFQQDTSPVGTKITSCTAVPPSDYRWKNDLGPITGALARLMQLQPKRLEWKTGGEFEGFIAHEAEPVVPYLVDGKKDAVDDNGGIVGQGFAYGQLTALLTAGLQEAVARIEALEQSAA